MRTQRLRRRVRFLVREFAPPYEVSAGDGGAMLRTHSTKHAVRVRAGFDEVRGTKKEKAGRLN